MLTDDHVVRRSLGESFQTCASKEFTARFQLPLRGGYKELGVFQLDQPASTHPRSGLQFLALLRRQFSLVIDVATLGITVHDLILGM
jgi:hypothetical protein